MSVDPSPLLKGDAVETTNHPSRGTHSGQCQKCAHVADHGWYGGGSSHCRRCHKSWTGTTAAHCTRCCETFTTTSAADKHWTKHGHVHPSEVKGLEAKDRSYGVVWGHAGRWEPEA